VVVSIDPVPPSITSVQDLSNSKLGPNNPAQPGDVLNLLVNGLALPGSTIAPGRVHVKVGGRDTAAGSLHRRMARRTQFSSSWMLRSRRRSGSVDSLD